MTIDDEDDDDDAEDDESQAICFLFITMSEICIASECVTVIIIFVV